MVSILGHSSDPSASSYTYIPCLRQRVRVGTSQRMVYYNCRGQNKTNICFLSHYNPSITPCHNCWAEKIQIFPLYLLPQTSDLIFLVHLKAFVNVTLWSSSYVTLMSPVWSQLGAVMRSGSSGIWARWNDNADGLRPMTPNPQKHTQRGRDGIQACLLSLLPACPSHWMTYSMYIQGKDTFCFLLVHLEISEFLDVRETSVPADQQRKRLF